LGRRDYFFVFFVAEGFPGAVATFAGGAGATVSVVVGVTLEVPGVIVDAVSVAAFGTPVLLCAVSVLTTCRPPHPTVLTRARVTMKRFMPISGAETLPAASILYFHGFASSPQSQKLVALKQVLDMEINSPDMNVPSFEELDFEAMMNLALDHARRRPPTLIVGSSLGSIVALELVRRGITAPLVLIAPAIGIGDRWIKSLPAGDPVRVFNHARNAEAPIHRAFFEQLTRIRPESAAPVTPVSIVMGRQDESVPFALVRDVWERWQRGLVAGSRFIEIAGGDHGLVAYVDVIANEIRARTRERRPARMPQGRSPADSGR